MKEKSFFFILLSLCFNYILSQLNDIKIGEIIEDTTSKKKFYRAELTNRTADYLVIYVEPSDDYEKYSDPDVFVSQVNQD
jgi:hypothetical protein